MLHQKNPPIAVGVLILKFSLPGCSSLKEKRSLIKPVIHRLHQEFNLAVVELDYQDAWHQTVIGCASLSNHRILLEKVFQDILLFCREHFRDLELVETKVEWL